MNTVHNRISLSKSHPELIEEWDDERNIDDFYEDSTYKAKWKCNKHTYVKEIFKRTLKGYGCHYCSGRKVWVGDNDLGTTHPELIKEWVDSRDITEFTANSEYKAQWQCKNNHPQWKTSIRHRAKNNSGCPYCAGQKPIPGETDLLSQYPKIASEWANEKNSPEEVHFGSHSKVRWQCEQGHYYYCEIRKRTLRNYGCNICANTKVVPGENDLGTTHPHLAQEWNDESSVNEITAGNGNRKRWKCINDHIWYTSPNNRTKTNGTNCPKCSKNVSQAESEIYEYVKNILSPNTVIKQNDRSVISKELDIYIPEKSMAIEFNGLYWHSEANGKDRFYHYNKFNECQSKGIKLLSIWEDDWRENKEAVKNLIKHKLGLTEDKVFARKTYFSVIKSIDAIKFLDKHHLQGGNKSSKHYGLRRKDDDELVAVMSMRYTKGKKELEIKRFASSISVVGGFSKLLNRIIAQHHSEHTLIESGHPVYHGAHTVVSYSHNDHSWGEVYAKNGFTKVHDGTPGYFYVRNSRREFRLNYSPKRFRERDDLVFVEGRTERELAKLNNLERIWDCGSARWEKKI